MLNCNVLTVRGSRWEEVVMRWSGVGMLPVMQGGPGRMGWEDVGGDRGSGNRVHGGHPKWKSETVPWSLFPSLPPELITALQGQGPT